MIDTLLMLKKPGSVSGNDKPSSTIRFEKKPSLQESGKILHTLRLPGLCKGEGCSRDLDQYTGDFFGSLLMKE